MTNVQYGTITIAGSATSGTATITSVDTTKSVVFALGQNFTDSASSRMAYLALTDATTVTATCAATDPGFTTTIAFVVATFTTAVSVQYGTVAITLQNTSATATITAVTVANALLVYAGQTAAGSLSGNLTDLADITLTNTTTVTATRNSTGANSGTTTVAFFVVAFS